MSQSGRRSTAMSSRLLFISSMWPSNCDPVPTNDFRQELGDDNDDRLSRGEEPRLNGLDSRDDDDAPPVAGSAAGLAGRSTAFTLLCTVTRFTMTILPFFRPNLSNTSRSSSTSSNVSSPDPSQSPPPPPVAIYVVHAPGANRRDRNSFYSSFQKKKKIIRLHRLCDCDHSCMIYNIVLALRARGPCREGKKHT